MTMVVLRTHTHTHTHGVPSKLHKMKFYGSAKPRFLKSRFFRELFTSGSASKIAEKSGRRDGSWCQQCSTSSPIFSGV